MAFEVPRGSTIKHLAPIGSDHCPLFLSLDHSLSEKSKPFRFEDFWLEHEQSWEVLRNAWPFNGPGFSSEFHRLRQRKQHSISRWSGTSSIELRPEIHDLQKLEAACGGLSHDNLTLLRSKLAEYHNVLHQQERFWRQKYRESSLAY